MKIKRKLFLGYAVISLFLAIVGYVILLQTQQALKNSIGDSTVMLAERLMTSLDYSLHDRIEEIQGYAKDSILMNKVNKSNLEFGKRSDIQGYIRQKDREWISVPEGTLTPFMKAIINNSLSNEIREKNNFYLEHENISVFPKILVTNRYGAVIAASGRTSDYFQADELWYQNAVAAQDYWIGDAEYDESSKSFSCDIVIKLYDDAGEFSGILKAVLNMDSLTDILRQSEKHEQAQHGAKTMEFKLLSHEGTVLYSSEEFVMFERLSGSLFSLVGKGGSGYVIAEGDMFGEGEELFTYYHSQGFEDYTGLEWILIVEHETAEIYERVGKLRNYLLIILLFLVMMPILIGYYISRAVAAPLVQFKSVAEKIGAGDLDARIEIDTGDEVGELATYFNDMLESLSNVSVSRDKLVEEVAERMKVEGKLRQALVVFDESNDAILITDKHGNIVATNNAYTEISGYQEEEVLGNHPDFMKSERHEKSFYRRMWKTLRKTNQWNGEVWNRRKDGETYPTWLNIKAIMGHNGEVNTYVAVFSDLTKIKESQAKLNHLANHDPLTNLPNRKVLTDRLEHAFKVARRDEGNLAVLYLDLDRFKNVNDSRGYLVGDKLLLLVSERLTSLVREEDTVGRLVGDEFLIIMEELSNPEDAGVLAQKLIDGFIDPFIIDEHEIFMTSCIGISIYPENGEAVSSQITNADVALVKAKEQGLNSYLFYSDNLTELAVERAVLETQLRRALERNEFHLVYQAQVSLDSGKLMGAEALIRWEHPELGTVPPDRFIEIAEKSGLILPIGEWVLRTACQQIVDWHSSGHELPSMAVNVAGPQMKRVDMVALTKSILDEVGLDPRYLELEITEGFLMTNPEKTIALLHNLRALGVRLAIDDFGTGYSSLSYLKLFPINKLKIDQVFVRNDSPDDKAIAHAVIALGHALGLKVIAEGVETEANQVFLHDAGCDEGQGYLYSKPMRAAEFLSLLENQT